MRPRSEPPSKKRLASNFASKSFCPIGLKLELPLSRTTGSRWAALPSCLSLGSFGPGDLTSGELRRSDQTSGESWSPDPESGHMGLSAWTSGDKGSSCKRSGESGSSCPLLGDTGSSPTRSGEMGYPVRAPGSGNVPLGVWGNLLTDPERNLPRTGPETQMPTCLRRCRSYRARPGKTRSATMSPSSPSTLPPCSTS